MQSKESGVNSCQHTEGVFLGIQNDPFKGTNFALYICRKCNSTFSKPISYFEASIALNAIKREHFANRREAI